MTKRASLLFVSLFLIVLVGGSALSAVASKDDGSKDKEKPASASHPKSGKSKNSDGRKTKKSEGSSTTSTTAVQDKPVGLGTPDHPYIGGQHNTNPVLINEAQNWTELARAVDEMPSHGQWYKDGLRERNGIAWIDVLHAAELESSGHDLRAILVSNTSVSDQEARQALADKGMKNVSKLPVVRVNGFINTAGLPHDKMSAFRDDKSQIRLTLLLPLDWNDLSKGLNASKGVLVMCGNPWNRIPVHKAKPAKPVTTTTMPPPTTTTTRPPSTTTTTVPSTTTTLPLKVCTTDPNKVAADPDKYKLCTGTGTR